MSNQSEPGKQAPKSVSSLSHFPFSTWSEFNKAIDGGSANFAVDSMAALNWSRNGIYAPRRISTQIMLLGALIPVAVIGFIIYVVVARNWLLLIALPLWLGLFSLLLLSPGVRSLHIAALAWGLISGNGWLVALSLPPLIFVFANRMVDRIAGAALGEQMKAHEDLFCLVWSAGALKLTLSNGNVHTSEFKIESGKFVSHTS